ncbi:MAG TPA: SAM-dependent methyltransferase [Burkholderiales bacterium]|nr:SAM-dependent methyltransferase [Burkholderiales bacterium]
MPVHSLPEPDAAARAASAALLARIAQELEASGHWMSFARYMTLALHAPGLGYYASGNANFGAAGDYVTAPELGTLFARTLARQVAELLAPGDAVLEFGAGSGALAAALIEALAALGARPEYLILEPSAELAARQRARLRAPARWIHALPETFRGVVIANEVLDVMPAHALAWTPQGVLERGVCLNEGQLAWCERPAEGEVLAAAQALHVEVHGRYESELNLAARAWIRTLADRLLRGAVLVIDYGFPAREYYHPQRSRGTLMCHYRHRAHGDPFFLPGLQDITAHVDFSALAQAAADAGLDVLGYTGQAQFLINCGITELLGEADASDVRRYAPLAAEAQTLLSPTEMGELFKVIAFGRGIDAPLRGFTSGGRAHTL